MKTETIEEAARRAEGMYVLEIWRGQATKWHYYFRHPSGGGSGTSTETSDAERIASDVVRRACSSWLDRDEHDRVLVLIGPSRVPYGRGHARKLSRSYWVDSRTGEKV